MAAKTQAAESSPRGGRPTQRHEIVGILSMAFALFALLSLLSMQLGTNQMMGPGGAATAAGLYTLAGLSAYLVIAGLTVAAVRCFRARPLVAGSGRGGGGGAAAGRGRDPAAPAVRRARDHVSWSGRPARAVPGRGRRQLHRRRRRGAGRRDDAVRVAAAAERDPHPRSDRGARLGGCARPAQALWAGLCAVGRVARAAFPEKDDRDDDEAHEDGDGGRRRRRRRAPDRRGPHDSRSATRTSAP